MLLFNSSTIRIWLCQATHLGSWRTESFLRRRQYRYWLVCLRMFDGLCRNQVWCEWAETNACRPVNEEEDDGDDDANDAVDAV
uniref:Secreted protein n=1 Tax=Mesocestoides corti TaxID=53468 RepID=A0A5K3FVK0_MESCO